MKRFYRNISLIAVVGILSGFLLTTPTWAGEPPGGVIGPMNPTMYSCREGDGEEEIVQPDPFIKETVFRFVPGGRMIPFDTLDEDGKPIFSNGPALLDPTFRDEEFVRVFGTRSENGDGTTARDDQLEHYSAQLSTCESKLWVNFGFDPTDAVQYEAYLDNLDKACTEAGGTIVPIEETRIEGFVYEFHEGANGEWFGVPSRDVPVHLHGITFDLEWGTDSNGYYYFHDLGAGPMVLNLRLPPDAHPINPNVVLFSSGLDSGKPDAFSPFTVLMGFYRGNKRPTDVTILRAPDGNSFPFSSAEDIDLLRDCGYLGNPGGQQMPSEVLDMSLGMPYVGGPPQPTSPFGIVGVSVMVVVTLFMAGGWQFYRRM